MFTVHIVRMATIRFEVSETPAVLPLSAGVRYLLQNVSTRYEINVSEGAMAARTSPAYRIGPLQFLGIRKDSEDIHVWTSQGSASARITYAEAV